MLRHGLFNYGLLNKPRLSGFACVVAHKSLSMNNEGILVPSEVVLSCRNFIYPD